MYFGGGFMKVNLKVITKEDYEIDYKEGNQVVSVYNEDGETFEKLMIELLKQVVINR